MVCKLEVCHSYELFYSRLNEVVTQKQSLKVWELIHFILWTEDKDNPQYSMPLSRYQEVHGRGYYLPIVGGLKSFMSSVISISLAAPAMETYHKCDSVSAEVEFCQGLQTTEVGDACDLVASQVEHPQVYKVSKTLDISNLKHKREGKDTHHSTDGMLLLFQMHHLTMFPCRSRTSNLRSVCKPDILRILEYRKEQKDHVIQVLSHMIQVLSHMIQC